MKIFEILYYYYFAFYLRVDDEPHSMTVFALSFSKALLIYFIAQMISVHFYCYLITTWQMISMFALVLIVNYFLFIRSGTSRKIVKARMQDPQLGVSKRIKPEWGEEGCITNVGWQYSYN
jgi:hypothetical protein